MRFEEVHANLGALVGAQVTIDGRLIVANTPFVAASYEGFRRGERLPVDNAGIEKHLLMTLPPYGGGDCIYDEDVVITGTIARIQEGFQLERLRDCTVFREGETIVIPLDRVSQGG